MELLLSCFLHVFTLRISLDYDPTLRSIQFKIFIVTICLLHRQFFFKLKKAVFNTAPLYLNNAIIEIRSSKCFSNYFSRNNAEFLMIFPYLKHQTVWPNKIQCCSLECNESSSNFFQNSGFSSSSL